MEKISLILLAAGSSTRFKKSNVKKQWIRSGKKPLWLFVADRFKSFFNFDKIIITASKDEINYMQYFSDEYIIVEGGNTRQESIKNALQYVTNNFVMVSDVARSCVPKNVVLDLIKNKNKADCIVPIIGVSDTVIYNDNTIDRNKINLIQTPQLSKTSILKKAILQEVDFTDDSSAIKSIGGSVFYIKGSVKSHKLTFKSDLKKLPCLKKAKKEKLFGFGYDLHRFDENKDYLMLGGVRVDCGFGFVAHSDGDVLIHSLIDAILGAIGAGDIGEFFPDSDEKYKNISSVVLLKEILNFIEKVGYKLVQVDLLIISQKPKITPIKKEIRFNLAKILNINPIKINLKATTNEGVDAIGDGVAMAVKSLAILKVLSVKY